MIMGVLLAGALALSGPSLNADIEAMAAELAQAKEEITLMQAKTGPDKALPAGCLTFPLPTTPVGPKWTKRYDRLGKLTDVIVWRQPCSGGKSVVLVTLKPVTSNAYFCSTNTNIIQGDSQLSSIYVVKGTRSTDYVCGDVLIPVTGWINNLDSQQLDHDKGFTLVINYFTGNGRLAIPAYDPAAYSVGPPPAAISKDYSGSWFTNVATVQNQGWALIFNEELRMGAAYWFTGSADGKSLEWFTAVGDYQNATATLDVFKTTGVTFAGATGESVEFGTLKIEFESCSSGLATYDLHDGRKGSLTMERLLPAPNDCK